MIEEAIVAVLLADVTLAGIVSGRIYPLRLPERVAFPAVTYYRIGGDPVLAMQQDAGLASARISVVGWSKRYLQARDANLAARDALRRFKGTSAGVVIQDVLSEMEGIDQHHDQDQTYQRTADLIVWYERPRHG